MKKELKTVYVCVGTIAAVGAPMVDWWLDCSKKRPACDYTEIAKTLPKLIVASSTSSVSITTGGRF